MSVLSLLTILSLQGVSPPVNPRNSNEAKTATRTSTVVKGA